MMLFIDSTLYIDWLRKRVEPARILRPWLMADAVATCGVVRAEVVRGVIHPRQRQRVHEFFDLLREIDMNGALWRKAAELAWRLDRQGVVLPITDIAIAACALSSKATVITTDEHFSHIPGLRTRKELPESQL